MGRHGGQSGCSAHGQRANQSLPAGAYGSPFILSGFREYGGHGLLVQGGMGAARFPNRQGYSDYVCGHCQVGASGSVAQEIIDRWKSPDGELVYIINPMKGSEGEGEDIAKVKNDIPELLDCIRFSIANKSFYNNLRAMLDIPVRREQ